MIISNYLLLRVLLQAEAQNGQIATSGGQRTYMQVEL